MGDGECCWHLFYAVRESKTEQELEGKMGPGVGSLGWEKSVTLQGLPLVSAPDLVEGLRPAREDVGPQSRFVQLSFVLSQVSCWISLEIFL